MRVFYTIHIFLIFWYSCLIFPLPGNIKFFLHFLFPVRAPIYNKKNDSSNLVSVG